MLWTHEIFNMQYGFDTSWFMNDYWLHLNLEQVTPPSWFVLNQLHWHCYKHVKYNMQYSFDTSWFMNNYWLHASLIFSFYLLRNGSILQFTSLLLLQAFDGHWEPDAGNRCSINQQTALCINSQLVLNWFYSDPNDRKADSIPQMMVYFLFIIFCIFIPECVAVPGYRQRKHPVVAFLRQKPRTILKPRL